MAKKIYSPRDITQDLTACSSVFLTRFITFNERSFALRLSSTCEKEKVENNQKPGIVLLCRLEFGLNLNCITLP